MRRPLSRSGIVLAPAAALTLAALALTVTASTDWLLVDRPAPPPVPRWDTGGFERPPSPEAGRRPGRPPWRGERWQLLEERALQDILVLTVETTDVHDAVPIAREIIEPLVTHYLEVLVYIRRPGDDLATTRVRWSPRDGYTTLELSPAPPTREPHDAR